ncbi:MAG: DEAD/DEAH box helicase family protein, partial [bacterium]|nr:DEAD/DEAH box helicase family protein [bacterium]
MLPLRSHRFKIRYGPEDDALHDFYLPALERSIRYARTAGFFSAPTLAAAATGIVRLIAGGGSMRLLCGARLAKSDLEALRSGAALEPRLGDAMVRLLGNPRDPALKGRLEALAWMLAHRHLAIRVVLPLGADGHPLPGPEAYDYYQPREGVFYDAAGHKLGFTGSGHETKGAWQHGPETCLTITSWDRRAGAAGIPASPLHIEAIERRFEELWEGVIDGWIALDLPAAPRERLLAFCPAQAPVRDPLERPAVPVDAVPATPAAAGAERLVLRFLREAPFLPNAQGLGIETSAVKPWPHQLRVVRQAVERYPESFLFCDEVGLGKTIEAGLALRQLVISGRVRRALLLVPKSVLRQWQEELYEKLALNVPRYDGGALVDAFGRELAASAGAAAESVWNVCPLLLASSQLAKRRERRAELLAAEPWDLVIVDEAHHARRKELRTDRYRPNRLLELLAGGAGGRGLRDRTRCLYLLTATPMQVHAVEVWDLLKLLGLGGRWGALEGNFLGFFRELRRPFPERDWDFLLDLLADYLEAGGELDPAFSTAAAQRLGPERWAVVRELPHADERLRTIAELDPAARAVVDEMLRR